MPLVPFAPLDDPHLRINLHRKTITLQTHPHILDAILSYSSFSALLSLRATSRALQDRVDETLLRHIAVHPAARPPTPTFFTYHQAAYRRLPSLDWLSHPSLPDAVRIVDIVVEGKESVRVDYYGEHSSRHRSDRGIYSPFCAICWCRKIDRDQPLLRTLARRLHRVTLVRRWGGHTCSNPIRTERTIDFYPPGDAEQFRPRKWKMKKTGVHVVHAAYPVESTIRFLPFAAPSAREAVVRVTVLPPACLFPWEEQSRWQARHAWDLLNMTENVLEALRTSTKCTLVGLDAWRWQLPEGHDDLYELLRMDVKSRFTSFLQQATDHPVEDVVKDIVEDMFKHHLFLKTEKEYCEELQPEVEALEAYCSWPPSS